MNETLADKADRLGSSMATRDPEVKHKPCEDCAAKDLELERLRNPPALADCKPGPWTYSPRGEYWFRWSDVLQSCVALVHQGHKLGCESDGWKWAVGHPRKMDTEASGHQHVLQDAMDAADVALENSK